MAGALAQAVDEELTCSLCLDLYDEPKALPTCGHVFCKKCLVGLLRGKKKGHIVNCPECRAVIRIDKRSVSSLNTHLKLRNLVEKRREDAKSASVQTPTDIATCPIHEGQTVLLFCVTCKVLICQMCLLESHNGQSHVFKGIPETHQVQMQEMTDILKETCKKIEQSRDILSRKKSLKEHISRSKLTECKAVDKLVEERVNEINEEGEKLKTNIQQAVDLKVNELERHICELDKDVEKAEDLHAAALRLKSNASDIEYVRHHDDLVDKLKEVIDVNQCEVNLPLPVVTFLPNKSPESTLGTLVKDSEVGSYQTEAKKENILKTIVSDVIRGGFTLFVIFILIITVLPVCFTILFVTVAFALIMYPYTVYNWCKYLTITSRQWIEHEIVNMRSETIILQFLNRLSTNLIIITTLFSVTFDFLLSRYEDFDGYIYLLYMYQEEILETASFLSNEIWIYLLLFKFLILLPLDLGIMIHKLLTAIPSPNSQTVGPE